MVRKLERKAGASIASSDDKYPTHRKHTARAGEFKAAITSERHRKQSR